MARVDEWLSALKERSGSDLHLAAGAAPRMRAKGELGNLEGEAPLMDAALRALMREIVSEEQWKGADRFDKEHAVASVRKKIEPAGYRRAEFRSTISSNLASNALTVEMTSKF